MTLGKHPFYTMFETFDIDDMQNLAIGGWSTDPEIVSN